MVSTTLDAKQLPLQRTWKMIRNPTFIALTNDEVESYRQKKILTHSIKLFWAKSISQRSIFLQCSKSHLSCILSENPWVRAPPQVCIQATTIPGSNLGVFCCQPIRQGTQMGPFLGSLSEHINHLTENCWEVCFSIY